MSESPHCTTNIPLSDVVVDQSDPYLQILCRVQYNGVWIPDFICAAGLAGSNSTEVKSSSGVVYHSRVMAAADIGNYSVLRCTMTFRLSADHHASMPADADVPHFNFPWSTPVNTTGETITHSCFQQLYHNSYNDIVNCIGLSLIHCCMHWHVYFEDYG